MFANSLHAPQPQQAEGSAKPDPVTTPANPEPVEGQSLADIVREETDNGRLIVRFLINLMQGNLESARPCHRLDAARQLLNLGYSPAQSFIATGGRSVRRRATARPEPVEGRAQPVPASPLVLSPSQTPHHHDLAALVCEETDNGRAAVRFLVDVMQGNLPDFKPHHRLSAAKELLHRGFDRPSPDPEAESEAEAEACDDDPRKFYNDPDGLYIRGSDGKWHRDERRSPPFPNRGGSAARVDRALSAPSPYSADCNIDTHEYGPTCSETCNADDCHRLRDCRLVIAASADDAGSSPETLAQPEPWASSEHPPEVQPPKHPPPPEPASTAARISLDSTAVDSLNPNLFSSSEILPVPG